MILTGRFGAATQRTPARGSKRWARIPLVGRVSVCAALVAVGCIPAVALAPVASAAASFTVIGPSGPVLTGTVAFGTVPVGQLVEQDVLLQNRSAGGLSLPTDLATLSSNSPASPDFVVGPPQSTSAPSCLTLTVQPIDTCLLGVFFLPTQFGARATTITVSDTSGGTFRITVSGTGVAGYYIAGQSGDWETFGFQASDLNSDFLPLSSPVVGIAGSPSGDGFWLATADGSVLTQGSATFFGSMDGTPLNQPIVGIAATSDGGGYWLVAKDGGIFTFGDASFLGSTGNLHLNAPIVGMAATPDGTGYWLVASDGGIFTFGSNAGFFGSTGATRLNKPIVGMAAAPDGSGYWLVASDGGIFTFGTGFFGSAGGMVLNQPIVGMVASPTGAGYWLVAKDGGIFSYGDVPFEGAGDLFAQKVDAIGMATNTAPVLTAGPTVASVGAAAGGRAARILAALRSGKIHLYSPSHR